MHDAFWKVTLHHVLKQTNSSVFTYFILIDPVLMQLKMLSRYPDDVYDRMWSPYDGEFPDSVRINSNVTMSSEQGLNDSYKLPEEVLSTAVRSINASIPLKYEWNFTNTTSQWLFCLYFNEVEKLELRKQREMVIDINNQFNQTVKLEYLKPETILAPPSPMTGSTVYNFTISATGNSGLPPILNAFDVLQVILTNMQS